MAEGHEHDRLTVVAIAALAFVVADLSHEALGHGVAASLLGAKQIVLSYTYLSTDLQSRGISAAGPLVNVVEGGLALVLLRKAGRGAAISLFLFLVASFNLLVAAAYLVYSGASNSGDLGVVIAGLPYLWAIRTAMCLAGLVLYLLVTVAVGRDLRHFQMPSAVLMTAAYLTALGLDCGAALFNPLGLKYFLISALPTTAAANAGLFAMPRLSWRISTSTAPLRVEHNYPWVIAGFIAAVVFIFLVGPGITLRH